VIGRVRLPHDIRVVLFPNVGELMSMSLTSLTVPVAVVFALAGAASAQTATPSLKFAFPETLPAPAHAAARTTDASTQPVSVTGPTGEWLFTVYPILAWVPANLSIEVEGPFDIPGGGGGNGGGSGGSGGGQVGGKIVDKRFDGAALAGFSATNGTWRFDFNGVYAAVGGDRVTPNLVVDVNLIYMHATVAREIAAGFFVTGGVRRFALKYEIDFLDYDTFTSKPGIWDPLVGVAYHKIGEKLEFHANADYGGFGVGADTDFGLGARIDWKPFRHFGFAAGYNHVSFKFKKDVGPYEFSAKQTVGGPVVGIGLYF
jgi:hypothetical protein